MNTKANLKIYTVTQFRVSNYLQERTQRHFKGLWNANIADIDVVSLAAAAVLAVVIIILMFVI
jgi:hypothetical protein